MSFPRHDGSEQVAALRAFAPPPSEIGLVRSAEGEEHTAAQRLGCGLLLAAALAGVVTFLASWLLRVIGETISRALGGLGALGTLGEWAGLALGGLVAIVGIVFAIRDVIHGSRGSLSYVGAEGVAFLERRPAKNDCKIFRFADLADVEVVTEGIGPSGRMRVRTHRMTCRLIGRDGAVLFEVTGDEDVQTANTLHTTAGERHESAEARLVRGIARAWGEFRARG